MNTLADQLVKWSKYIPTNLFITNSPIKTDPSRYQTQGVFADSNEPNQKFPENIIINTSQSPYGIVLNTTKNDNQSTAAFLGFDVAQDVATCVQIQGGRNKYADLTPLRWDRALLQNLVDFSKEANLYVVRVFPAGSVLGNDVNNLERLMNRYDINARQLGFRLSSEQGMYVKEIRGDVGN